MEANNSEQVKVNELTDLLSKTNVDEKKEGTTAKVDSTSKNAIQADSENVESDSKTNGDTDIKEGIETISKRESINEIDAENTEGETMESDKAETKKADASNAEYSSDSKEEEEDKDVNDENLLHKPHSEVVLKLADQQADVDSPLYSVTSFEELGLSKELLKGIYTMGFKKPSKIQEKALPLLISNPPKNMIGQSQSGTGKTAAFVLNLLTRVDQDDKSLQGICVAPSRELAKQIMDVAKAMSQFTNIKLGYAIKKEQGTKHSKVDSQIVIGTPGTISNMIAKRLMNVSNVKVFVLDEADNMLDLQGHGDETLRIQRTLPRGCQNVLFSATFPDKVRGFAEKFAPNANQISLQVKELTIKAIKQFYIDCSTPDEKVLTLLELYSIMTIGQSIIFVNSKANADRLQKVMTAAKHKVIALHGGLDPTVRDAMVDTFRSGACKVMITTNVVARGLDISQVNLVVNFDVPILDRSSGGPDYETYLHRIGRTGRFGKSGVAINFVSDTFSLRVVKSFESHFSIQIQLLDPKKLDQAEELLHKALK